MDEDGHIVDYLWDLGDGTYSSQKVVEKQYSPDGPYKVVLRVTDDDGAQNTYTTWVDIMAHYPVSDARTNASADVGEKIKFNAHPSSDPDGESLDYFWEFGDGDTGDQMVVQKDFLIPGNYIVTLTVTDESGNSNVDYSKAKIGEGFLAFAGSDKEGFEGAPIAFDATTHPDIVSYDWEFGDGGSATGVSTNHVYAVNGIYIAKLTVEDIYGDFSVDSIFVFVSDSQPVANAGPDITVEEDEQITFDGTSSYAYNGIVHYYWDFDASNGLTIDAQGPSVKHTYTKSRQYTVTLTIIDGKGLVARDTMIVTVVNKIPEVNADYVSWAWEDEVVDFTGRVIDTPSDQNRLTYKWYLSDGSVNDTQNISHSFEYEDTYTIEFEVTDNDYDTGSFIGTIDIINKAPVAEFSADKSAVFEDDPITFNAYSSYDTPSDEPWLRYHWEFGDGNESW